MSHNFHFSGPVTVFQERRLPEAGSPAGYAALIQAFELAVPLPRTLYATGTRHKVVSAAAWHVLTPRHAPPARLAGHLTFALKYEGLNLLVLKKLFEATRPGPLEEIVKDTPTGSYARRLWLLYEWLVDARLDLPDSTKGAYVLVVDPKQQFGGAPETSPRHRVKNNLPGNPAFCPLVYRTEQLEAYIGKNLPARAREIVADVPRDILARTAAFLLLKDSKSSYAIEGEHPPQDRIQRWGHAIGEAGKRPLDLDELLRLQNLVIGDARFVKLGVRSEGSFVGEHDRDYRSPLPDHISARPDDLVCPAKQSATY